jgi:hypothetical protein
MYSYAPFVVTSSAPREQRPIYGGLYTTGGYGEGYRIILGLVPLQLLRRITIARNDMYFVLYLKPELSDGCVHLVMQRPGVIT